MDWNWNYQWGAPKSWICSSCGRSFSFFVSECPYCNNREVRRTTTTTCPSTDDSKWWEEYLKQSQTGKPVNDNPSITTATTNIDPNVKVTAWNNMETGHVEIGKDGSISWKGPTPEIHYPSTLQEWLEAFNEQFK